MTLREYCDHLDALNETLRRAYLHYKQRALDAEKKLREGKLNQARGTDEQDTLLGH